MHKSVLAVLIAVCVTTGAVAEPLKIIGFETGNGITFEGATVGNYYTLEFAPTPAGPWTNWGSVTEQPITGPVMSAPSPFFYRIRETDSSAFPPYATVGHTHSNITSAMLATPAVETANIANGAVTDAKIFAISGSKIVGDINTSGGVSADGGFWTADNVQGLDIIATRNLHADGTLDVGGGIWTTNSVTVGGTVQVDGTISAKGGISTESRIDAGGPIQTTNNVQGLDIIATRNLHADGTLDVGGGIWTLGNCTAVSFIQTSDQNLKEGFTPVDARDILDQVAALPISRWRFKTDETTEHIGPMAQDFYSAFHVGLDERHIATVDQGGVALAAIQGLRSLLKDKDAEIAALEKRLETLESLVLKSHGSEE